MPDASGRTFDQKLNTWVQTIGIIAAAIWGIFVFVQKEVMAPMSAPVNITLNLQLKKSGENVFSKKDPQARLIAVEMRVSATNPSSRTVYFLPSIWFVHGIKVASREDEESFNEEALGSLESESDLTYAEKHAEVESTSMVAAGRLFSDDFLRPGETTSVTLVFHVPPEKYDLLEARVQIPSAERPEEVVTEWELDKNKELTRNLYRVDRNSKRTKITDVSDHAKLGLQQAESTAQLSLWH